MIGAALPAWLPTLAEVNTNLNQQQRRCLDYGDSLTDLLRQITRGEICFSHDSSEQLTLANSDSLYLQQLNGLDSLRRIILWTFQQQLWVYAESIIPTTTQAFLPGKGDGSAPLGELLFAEPPVPHSKLQFASLSAEHALYQRACRYHHAKTLPAMVVARRRRFMITAQHPLMIVEVFFPECLAGFKNDLSGLDQ